MTKLLNDICRCHDSKCLRKQSCSRYIQRNMGVGHTPHAASLRDGDECKSYIDSVPQEFRERLRGTMGLDCWLYGHCDRFNAVPASLFGTDREGELWDMLDLLESGEPRN